MAFNQQSWSIISGAANNRVSTLQDGTFVGSTNVFTYISATDNLATIETANYFGPTAADINVGDCIYATGTDGSAFLIVTAVNVYLSTVTVTTTNASGDVVGPAVSVDGDVVLFSGTNGKIIKESNFAGALLPFLINQSGAQIYALDTGAANAYVITLAPVPAAYTTGMVINFKAVNANTGASTINVNGLGAKAIRKYVSVALAANDIIAGQDVTLIYDGTNFQMQSLLGNNTGTGSYVLATSPTITTPNIVGVGDASSAAAGSVGQVISSVIASGAAVNIASATATDMTSIALTAGDWDIYGNITFTPSATASATYAWASLTSATLPDASLYAGTGENVFPLTINGVNAPFLRVNVAAPTTVYLSGYANLLSGTCTMCGGIYARRVR